MRHLILGAFLALPGLGCGSAAPGFSENPGLERTDSLAASALTDIQATAESEQEELGVLPVRTNVVDGALRVTVGVGGVKECTFGQMDGPRVRDQIVEHGDLAIDLDEKDTHAWLFGGANIACEGSQPLFAWSLLDPHVSAPKVDLVLDEDADAMLSDADTYVVRVRGHAFDPVQGAKLTIGGETYVAKVTELRDEITHWEVTFDVPPEKWVRSVLRGDDAAHLVARVDAKSGVREVDARVTIGLDARITDASHQPLEDD
jgi:hypothetical protein